MQIEKLDNNDFKHLSRGQINNLLIEKGDIDTLYRRNYGLLVSLVKKYNKADIEDFEEAMSFGNVAFATAVRDYNKERAEFSTFLGMNVKDIFYKHWRTHNAKKRNTTGILFDSLDAPVGKSVNGSKDIILQDVLEDDKISVEDNIVLSSQLSNYIQYISTKADGEMCLKVIQLRAEDNVQTDIARKLGISQVQVSRKLLRVKKYIEEYEQLTQKEKTKIKGNEEMVSTNQKVEQVKQLIRDGITDRLEIAKILKVQATSASTYLSMARRELAAEGFKAPYVASAVTQANELPQKQEPVKIPEPIKEVSKQEESKKQEIKTVSPELKEKPKNNPVQEKNLEVLQKALPATRRLKARSIASDYFTYTIISENIEIISNKEDQGGLNLSKTDLAELIEDLRELESYL